MIGNLSSRKNIITSFIVTLFIHVGFIYFFTLGIENNSFLADISQKTQNPTSLMKLEDIKLIQKSEIEKLKKVGIKDGVKDLQRPDLGPIPPKTPANAPKNPGQPPLDLKNLGALVNEAPPTPVKPSVPETPKPNEFSQNILRESTPSKKDNDYYFSYSKNKVISRSQEQEIIKREATRISSPPSNKATQKISNFEIRYERPEGVAEDELNADEKAFYSFYLRSYQNYFTKIHSNYERIVIERPGLARAFESKHLLIGRVDYDENGEIIMVKILKSSENDDLHYFFEETLKQLTQPNPPKVFTKYKKEFSLYYQVHIN